MVPDPAREPEDRPRKLPPRIGYHDLTAGMGGAAPASSALTLRLVLAVSGLLTLVAAAVVFWVLSLPWWTTAAAAVLAAVALVDLVVVARRKAHGEPG